MSKLSKIVFLALMTLTLVSCQTASMEIEEKGLKPISTAELISLLSGKTVYGVASTGRKWVEFVNPNGTNYYKASGAKVLVGTWKANEDQVCYIYPTLRSGKPFCFQYYIEADVVRAFQTVGPDKGKWADKILEFKNGDIEGLS